MTGRKQSARGPYPTPPDSSVAAALPPSNLDKTGTNYRFQHCINVYTKPSLSPAGFCLVANSVAFRVSNVGKLWNMGSESGCISLILPLLGGV